MKKKKKTKKKKNEGNFPTNVKIENIHIKDFATHGVHLDGWMNLEMTNVEVGPSSTIEYIRGDYAHARLILPRLKAILSDLEEEGVADTKLIGFANRDEMKLEEIIDILEFEMDLVFDYALNRVYNKHSHNDYISPDLLPNAKKSSYWQSAKKQFAWKSGIPCATSLHGIFLNQWSASTQTFTLSTSNPSKNAKLTNIKIHDLKHSLYELFMIMRTSSTKLYGNDTYDEDVESTRSALPVLDLIPWNIPIDALAVFGMSVVLLFVFLVSCVLCFLCSFCFFFFARALFYFFGFLFFLWFVFWVLGFVFCAF